MYKVWPKLVSSRLPEAATISSYQNPLLMSVVIFSNPLISWSKGHTPSKPSQLHEERGNQTELVPKYCNVGTPFIYTLLASGWILLLSKVVGARLGPKLSRSNPIKISNYFEFLMEIGSSTLDNNSWRCWHQTKPAKLPEHQTNLMRSPTSSATSTLGYPNWSLKP